MRSDSSYVNQRNIRTAGFVLALCFVGFTLWNTNKLIQRIQQDERQQMELWGLAQQDLASSTDLNQAVDPLMPGTFVKASILGKSFENLIKMPASALSRDGYIWHVENGLLQRLKADIAYLKDDYLVVKAEAKQTRLMVVRYPQAAFLPGQPVNAETVASVWQETESTVVHINKQTHAKGA